MNAHAYHYLFNKIRTLDAPFSLTYDPATKEWRAEFAGADGNGLSGAAGAVPYPAIHAALEAYERDEANGLHEAVATGDIHTEAEREALTALCLP